MPGKRNPAANKTYKSSRVVASVKPLVVKKATKKSRQVEEEDESSSDSENSVSSNNSSSNGEDSDSSEEEVPRHRQSRKTDEYNSYDQQSLQQFGTPSKSKSWKGPKRGTKRKPKSEDSSNSDKSDSDSSSSMDSDDDVFNPSRELRNTFDVDTDDDKAVKNIKEREKRLKAQEERMTKRQRLDESGTKFTLVTGITPQVLRGPLSHKSLRSSGNYLKAGELIDKDLVELIGHKMAGRRIPHHPRKRWVEPEKMLHEAENEADQDSAVTRIRNLKPNVTDKDNFKGMDDYSVKVTKILSQFHNFEDELDTQAMLVKAILHSIRTCGSRGGVRVHDFLERGENCKTVFVKWQLIREGLISAIGEAAHWREDRRDGRDSANRASPPSGGNHRSDRSKERNRETRDRTRRQGSQSRDTRQGAPSEKGGSTLKQGQCDACGKENHKTSDCRFKHTLKHPDVNRSPQPWASSTKGKDWKEAGFDTLQGGRRIDGTRWFPEAQDGSTQKGGDRRSGAPGKGREQKQSDTTKLVVCDTVQMTILVNNKSLTISALVDTGALQANYIDTATAAWIESALHGGEDERSAPPGGQRQRRSKDILGETPTHGTLDSAHRLAPAPGQLSAPHDHPYLCLLIKKDQLLDPEPDDDGITLGGPEELQREIRKLFDEFPVIFGTELQPEPADLAPMEIEIDLAKWQTPKNRLPPRAQTRAKERHTIAKFTWPLSRTASGGSV
eukprot:gene21859-27931_t